VKAISDGAGVAFMDCHREGQTSGRAPNAARKAAIRDENNFGFFICST
jgi:hypothetical protein